MKKFIIYFCLIFIVTFGLLNARFVSAQIKYWFFPLVSRDHIDHSLIRTLPLSDSLSFFLEIPALGAQAPIVLEKSLDQNQIFKSLENGVVHYADSPLPGQKGAAIILGHSSAYPWYKGDFGSIFALLGRLKLGDYLYVRNGGKTFTYQVKESVVFHPFARDKSVDQIVRTDTSSIILVSCWPVGTNVQRIAVKADLVP